MSKEIYHHARVTKDCTYDGRFFFGVVTTGIFCKPSCPSPVAREENVRYFETAVEALEKGFRPCLRCRPDISLGLHIKGSADGVYVVQTALEMIYRGFLNDHSVAEMAAQLLVSDRHLRQLFADTMGVSPGTIARYHRALFAKKLLLSTVKPVSEIAFAAGFGSLRQFNDVFRQVFDDSPTAMRKEVGDGKSGTATTLLLPCSDASRFHRMLNFYRNRAVPGVEVVSRRSYSRSFRLGEHAGCFTVRYDPGHSALALNIVCEDITCYMQLCARVRRMFDLDSDFERIETCLSGAPVNDTSVFHGLMPGLPVAFSPFEAAVRSILGQFGGKHATKCAAKLARQGVPSLLKDEIAGIDRFFPEPEELADLDGEIQVLPKEASELLCLFSKAVASGALVLDIAEQQNQLAGRLLEMEGMEERTVAMILIRGLGMNDVFPSTDPVLRKALAHADNLLSPLDAERYARRWRPYRSYAALCLWNTYDNGFVQ